MATPKYKQVIHRFIILVNCYRDMWYMRYNTILPSPRLTSEIVKFKWTYVEQEAFKEFKLILPRYVLPVCPDFNKYFDTYTDERNFQFVTVIIQESK